jgi:hypothetical protein
LRMESCLPCNEPRKLLWKGPYFASPVLRIDRFTQARLSIIVMQSTYRVILILSSNFLILLTSKTLPGELKSRLTSDMVHSPPPSSQIDCANSPLPRPLMFATSRTSCRPVRTGSFMLCICPLVTCFHGKVYYITPFLGLQLTQNGNLLVDSQLCSPSFRQMNQGAILIFGEMAQNNR